MPDMAPDCPTGDKRYHAWHRVVLQVTIGAVPGMPFDVMPGVRGNQLLILQPIAQLREKKRNLRM